MFNIVSLLLPLAIDIIKKYIESSDSESDDKVLEIVKDGAKYLVCKDNNKLTSFDVKGLVKTEIKKVD